MEEWRSIVGFEGKYLISSHGRIYSLIKNDFKNIQVNKYGYEIIGLCINVKIKTCYVHRLVAEAFLDNPNNFDVVNHKDENPRNNNKNNLEWCTYQYNNTYGTRLFKARKKMSEEKNPRATKIRCLNDGRIFNTITEAGIWSGTHRSNIIKQIKGKFKTAGKHPETGEPLKWEYIKEGDANGGL